VRRSFAAFVERLSPEGTLVVCADDAEATLLTTCAQGRVVTYGLNRPADWAAHDLALDAHGARFTVRTAGRSLAVATRLSGRHNVANALAAMAAAAEAGVPVEQSAKVLKRFEPPLRRQEIKGRTSRGALVLDDYAHHHAEIAATLRGLRLRYPGRRLRVAFQPHTYSRTRAFLTEIAASLCEADDVAVAEVYAARERDTLGIGGADLARAARCAGACAVLTPSLDDVVDWLARDDGPDVLLVTMGAGDIWQAGERLLK
jgi:UDP-N-acetylmuramate--alanine ligase